MGKLEGHVAIVTGAGQGVGEGIAIALAKEGAAVCASGRTLWKVERTVETITSAGGRAIAVACDVGDREQIDQMVATTLQRLGPPDILVNNAQGGNDGEHGVFPVESIDDASALDAYRGGPLASLHCMQACFPHLKERGGCVVNLGSTTGILGMTGFGAFAMAKEAIRALTKTAANEWGRYGIRVNTVCPAAMSPASVEFSKSQPERFQQLLDAVPLGRMGALEADIGRAVAMLVSPDMAFITGATLMLDGGMTILR